MNLQMKILIVASLLGIMILLFLSTTIKPEKSNIADITEKNLNEIVKVQGKIISIREYNNQTFQVLKIRDETGTIDATSNSKTGLKERINISQDYMIIGKVSEYNKTIQISINQLF